MNFLHQLISNNSTTELLEIEKLTSCFKLHTISSGTILLDVGQISNNIYFVKSGTLREFKYTDEDITSTLSLIPENNFSFIPDSFWKKSPTMIGLQALEKVKLYSITREDLDYLKLALSLGTKLELLINSNVLARTLSYCSILRETPEVRLEWFNQFYPGLSNRIPHKYIASYLNIRPETLSRIRGRCSNSRKNMA